MARADTWRVSPLLLLLVAESIGLGIALIDKSAKLGEFNRRQRRFEGLPEVANVPQPRPDLIAAMFRSVEPINQLRRIRFWLAVFIVGLILSGITAFPLDREICWLDEILHAPSLRTIASSTGLLWWIDQVHHGVTETYTLYPFMAYGTDWLAFAHLVIAVAFIGPWIDPVRNKWVVTFGLIACVGVVPLALVAGSIRGIPIGWRLIDCSFGVFGSIPLLLCMRHIRELENQAAALAEP